MAKGLGLTGLIIGILALFIPVVALFVIWLALLCVTVSALAGDRLFSVATVALSAMNLIFFSPLTLIMLWGDTADVNRTGSMGLLAITLVLFAAPIVAIILNATGKFMLNQPDRAHRVVLNQ